MSETITIEIPKEELPSLEAALDETLAALRKLDDERARARQERIRRLQNETRTLIDQIDKSLNVEKTL
ncbi:MAG: hypothetical protein DMF74_02875 [Acidobacteria bacterium]|nr:MAG: hypothetical protein DMF74_02875 [Acidobacteriota bacterium]